MAFIYKITSPSGKIYVGSTIKTPKERWSAYFKVNCKPQIKIYNSLKKYGPEKHTFEVICECCDEDKLKLESYYGILFDVLDKKLGLNLRLPKVDEIYSYTSEETRQRMKGNKNGVGFRSEEFRKHLSNITKGEGNSQYGKHKTESQKLHQSQKMKGYNFGKAFALAISERQSKPIVQLTIENEYITEYKSAKQAFVSTGIRNIAACASGNRNIAGGFKWVYK